MKITRALIVTLVITGASIATYIWRVNATTNKTAPWLVGKFCPTWSVIGPMESVQQLSDFVTDRPLVAVLVSHKCGACIDLLNAMDASVKDISAKADIVVLNWPNASQTQTDISPQVEQQYILASTSQVHGYVLPTTLLIDAKKSVIFDQRGWRTDLWQIISKVLDSL